MRYAGGNVHDGNGALHPFLSGWAAKAAYFLSVSMMADKESSKETSVPIYDSIHKKQVLIMKQSDRMEKLSCTVMTEQA